ncbi:MAG: type II secretion system protein [Deltaproteobacteria bacterium]|nr:type II secretion system protein [Deltaproteobacteria bacterium]
MPGDAVKTSSFPLDCCRGMTLIELIVSIVVVGIALSALLGVFVTVVSRSADPLIQAQAQAVAESYLEEILLKPCVDPGGPPETGRSDYDDVMDYNGLSEPATNQFGAAVGLNDYQVEVAVSSQNLSSVPGRLVTVTVTRGDFSFSLSGWRAQY